jgi:alkylhydroperoxidase family enzyme
MVARVEMLSVDQAKAVARECGIRESMAGLSVYRTLLRHPQLAAAVNHLLTTLLFTGNKLDVRLRELLIMRIGWITGAKYEWTQHWHFAARVGLPPEDVLAVRDWRSSTRLGAADRAVLAAVDDTLGHGKISDSVWAECVRHVGSSEQMLEMVIAIGNWNMFAQLLRSLEIPLEEGVKSWPPDGKIPEGGDA